MTLGQSHRFPLINTFNALNLEMCIKTASYEFLIILKVGRGKLAPPLVLWKVAIKDGDLLLEPLRDK